MIQSDQTHHKVDESVAISVFKTNINQEQSTMEFIYSQLFMECLLQIEIDLSDRTQLISFCREIYKDNKIQLNSIEEFEQTYSSNQALSWYIRDTFLSKILNKALCMQNIDILLLFRFFLLDIRQQLEQNQYPSSVRLYRSLLISNEELQIWKDSIGGFVSINTFFSTKFNRQLALSDFDYSTLPDNLQRVLFEIDADPRLNNIKPFSTINSSEILMMSGSIFRLSNIHLNDDHLWIIQMKLCSTHDESLQSIFNSMKKTLGYDNKEQMNISTFGNILWKMNKLDEAEKYYLSLINLLPNNHLSIADVYYNLGHIYSDKNDYDSSLKWYNKSLEIWMKIFKSNNPDLANTYNAIATNYWKKNDYKQAFDSFNKALEIFKQAYDEDHITVAMCLNNMGTVSSNENNYSKALNYYLNALPLFQKHLSNNHPNLGSLHCNISTIYKHLNQIDLALEHLQLALKIYEKSLPKEHPNIIMMLKNIAFLYEQKEDYQQAIIYYEKLSKVYHQTSTATDPIVIQNEEKIQYLLSLIDKKHSVS